MRHPLAGLVAASVSLSATNYAPFLPSTAGATPADFETPMAAAGSIDYARLYLATPPGGANTLTVTLQKNNVDTAVVLSFGAADTDATYSGAPVSWAANDQLKWKSVPTGAGVSTSYSAVFLEVQTLNGITSIQGINGGNQLTSVTPAYFQVIGGNTHSTTAAANRTTVAPCAGTITGYSFYAKGTANAGTGWILTLYKNGTPQDGSGGTPDTRSTLITSTLTATVSPSFTLSVAAGDLLYLQFDRSGATADRLICGSIAFAAAISGQAPFGGITASLSTSANQFTNWANYDGGSAGAGALNTNFPHGKWDIDDLYVALSAAPSAGHTRTFIAGKNGAGTTLTCAVVDAATAANDTNNAHRVRVDAGDTIRMACNVAGSGTTAAIAYISAVISSVGKGAPGGSGNKKAGGGAISVQMTGGAGFINYNPGIDTGITG